MEVEREKTCGGGFESGRGKMEVWGATRGEKVPPRVKGPGND